MTKTILLADDSVTIQKVVELTFMDEDFRVSAVSNGAEAIARLGEAGPDVVITDVHMPGANGFEVCRRSKELYPAVPVLLLVGTFESFDADEAMRCGADGHLKKPFDSQELMRRVRELASAPSRTVPVPPAGAEFAAAEVSASAFGSEPQLAADDIYALPEPAEDLWEPLPEEVSDIPAVAGPSEEARVDFELPVAVAAVPPQTETATRFVPVQGVAAPAEDALFAPPTAAPAVALPLSATPEVVPAGLSDADVDRIARRVIELVGDKAVRDVAWEVVPDLAEVLLKSRIRELEASID